jgi:TPR repeat protein
MMLRTLLATSLFAAAVPAVAAETFTFDVSKYSQKPTGCDVLAAHPDDPLKVAPGVRQSQVDLPTAIAACEAAVARDPENPRLRYQLGRTYGYSGQGEKAGVHRDAAVAANYPQALFVIGYLYLNGENKAPKDPCRAAELIRRSAQYGRLSGQIGYPMWVLEGRFEGCSTPQDRAEMLAFLEAADAQTGDFYQESLIALLKRDVAAWQPAGKKRK